MKRDSNLIVEYFSNLATGLAVLDFTFFDFTLIISTFDAIHSTFYDVHLGKLADRYR